MNPRLQVLTVVLSGLSSLAVQAEELPILDPVYVSATRFESAPRVASEIVLISADEIRNSPAINLPDLLRTRAGLAVTTTTPGNLGIDAVVDLRGFGESALSNTLILIDGQRINPVDAGGIVWSTIPLNSIERIEIQRGGGTVLYGDRATGGVINIITDKLARPHASVAASLGSFGYNGLDISAGGSNQLGYGNLFLHGASTDGWRHNSQQDEQSIAGRLGTFVNAGEIAVDFATYRDSSGLPGYLTPTAYAADPRRAKNPFDTETRNGYRFRPGVKLKLTDTLTLEAEAGDAFEAQHWNTVSWHSTSDRDKKTQSATPRLRWNHGLAGLSSETVVGYDYYRGTVDAQSSTSPSQGASQVSSAFYLQNSTALSQDWTLTTGLRNQRMAQKAHQEAGAWSAALSGDSTRSRDAYDVGLSYDATQWRVYGKVGSTFRFANTDDLFGYDFMGNSYFAGNLKPQHGTTQEVGGNIRFGSAKLQGSLFRMDLNDEIGYDSAAGTNINLDPTRHQGLEIDANWPLLDKLSTRFSYAYTEATFRAGANNGRDVPLVPRSKASVQLTWQGGESGTYSAVSNLVGRRRYAGDTSNVQGYTAGYATLDFAASWKISQFKLSTRINNVFDKRYASFAGYSSYISDRYFYPADGRSVYLTLAYDFK